MERIYHIWAKSEAHLSQNRSWESLQFLAHIHDEWNKGEMHWNNSVFVDTEDDSVDFHSYFVNDVCIAYHKVMSEIFHSYQPYLDVYHQLCWELSQIIMKSEYHDDIHGCPDGLYIGA